MNFFIQQKNCLIPRKTFLLNKMTLNNFIKEKNSFLFQDDSDNGIYPWTTTQQGFLLSSFFYGYVITQIPFGILAKRYGSKYFLGVGMLINSLFGLLVPISAEWGFYWLMLVRFIQGLGEVSTSLAMQRVTLFVRLIKPDDEDLL